MPHAYRCGDSLPQARNQDRTNKQPDQARLGTLEYLRFDHTSNFLGTRLAGDRLAKGRYEPIPVEEVGEDFLRGFSAVLGLVIRWEHGQLRWHDPETGQEIPNFQRKRQARLSEREGRSAAGDRVRELEEELGRENR